MAVTRTCPSCGAEVPSNAPSGLCPACRSKEAQPSARQAAAAGNASDSTLVPSPHAERPGDRIGRYRLLQQIGEGGMGVVWMAEQQEDVHRRVALKVVKPGMDSKQVLGRFEAEREALARMDHPHIAKVLDAGTTETGRPFFVMELVSGEPITTFCDRHNISTRGRMDLFVKVCQAIQHAHQKGIIHRDIKPSNILVSYQDGQPIPKVIDFGIAKALQGRLTDLTVFTAIEQFIGTPAYMSPEQAEMGALDIDTRSDIYSLGVLFYELLTGRTPFDTQELLVAGLDQMRRTIREKDPLRPSKRITTLDAAEQTVVAKRHQSEPPKLLSLIRGDLDWIVMKCLEKDRMRRYETAAGLAADIERHLKNEPILARPPSTAYRFGKLVRRNRLAFAAGVAVAVSLMIGLLALTFLWLREKRSSEEQARLRLEAVGAKQKEAAQRLEAESLRRSSESAMRFARIVLLSTDTYNVSDPTSNVDLLLRSAEDELPALRKDERAGAMGLSTMGRIASNWGRQEQATNWLGQSVEKCRHLVESALGEAKAQARQELAVALNYLAWATVGNQQNPEGLAIRASRAVPFAQEAFDIRKSLGYREDDDTFCLQADWIRIRQLANDPHVDQEWLNYFAALAGRSPEQYATNFYSTLAETTRLTAQGKRAEARDRIRQSVQPFLNPTRPQTRSRIPLGLAHLGEKLRSSAPTLAKTFGLLIGNQKQIEDCGAVIIEVAAELAKEILLPQHPDAKEITRLSKSLAN